MGGERSVRNESELAPELCKRRYSRDHRPDCVQVNVALVVTREGMPLAYDLWKTLQKWQSQAGLGDSPRTLLTELARIQSADIVLPLATDRRELRLRCVVRPEREQAILLDHLGLKLPDRLAVPTMLEM